MNITHENFVGIYEGLFSQEFCEQVIKYFEDMNSRGNTRTRLQAGDGERTFKDDTSVNMSHENVVSLDQTRFIMSQFDDVFWSYVYADYANRYAVLKDAHPHSIPHLRVQRTDIGEAYHVWHFETSRPAVSNRLMAFILYLNDVEDGGETEFLYFPKRIKPKMGTLVLFPASYTHTHRGNQPLTNSKYIITGWVEY